ncbi:MAG: cation:proton antiporter [Gammaproteobacteria bacterium]
MSIFTLISTLFTIAVMVSYINHRYIKLQSTIAITIAAVLISLCLMIAAHLGFSNMEKYFTYVLHKLDFHHLLMHGMLSFLLFAGALTIDLSDLRSQKWEITILALLGTIISTFIIGWLTFYLLQFLGQGLPMIYCMLFGALISPTDPIAVLAIFRKVGAPRSLDSLLAGESLFNDGVGVVLFLTIYQMAFNGEAVTAQHVISLFIHQAAGGIVYGILLGYLGYWLIKGIDHYVLEIFITLGITTGGYTLAQAIDISGPLAMVVAGIFIGNHKKLFHMKAKTRQNIEVFWEVIDMALNALLFLLIGLELNLIKVSWFEIAAGLAAIIITLLARTITVGGPLFIMGKKKKRIPFTIPIMVWGGLRGGLAIALALAIPYGHPREILLPMAYAVVIFSIIVQGLTVKYLVAKTKP